MSVVVSVVRVGCASVAAQRFSQLSFTDELWAQFGGDRNPCPNTTVVFFPVTPLSRHAFLPILAPVLAPKMAIRLINQANISYQGGRMVL